MAATIYILYTSSIGIPVWLCVSVFVSVYCVPVSNMSRHVATPEWLCGPAVGCNVTLMCMLTLQVCPVMCAFSFSPRLTGVIAQLHCTCGLPQTKATDKYDTTLAPSGRHLPLFD